jgi:hypothetical protein
MNLLCDGIIDEVITMHRYLSKLRSSQMLLLLTQIYLYFGVSTYRMHMYLDRYERRG